MSKLLRASGEIADDRWQVLDDAAAWPAEGAVIVSLDRWRKGNAPQRLSVGVRIPNTEDVAALAPLLLERPLIELEIPKFGDGRAYTQARLLRERYAYRGEIRARGDVLVDQLRPMARCGVDTFILRADQSLDTARRVLREFGLAYQHGAERPAATVWERRRAAG